MPCDPGDLHLPISKLKLISELFYSESDGIKLHLLNDETIAFSFILKEIADAIEAVKKEWERA